MGDTVKCAFCGVLEDWEDFHVWGCEVCDKVFCDDCAPAGSDPMNPRKLILCPECAAKQCLAIKSFIFAALNNVPIAI